MNNKSFSYSQQEIYSEHAFERRVTNLYWDSADHLWRILPVGLESEGNHRGEDGAHSFECRDFREALRRAKAIALIEGVDLHIYSQDQRLEEVRSFLELAEEVNFLNLNSGLRPWMSATPVGSIT